MTTTTKLAAAARRRRTPEGSARESFNSHEWNARFTKEYDKLRKELESR